MEFILVGIMFGIMGAVLEISSCCRQLKRIADVLEKKK